MDHKAGPFHMVHLVPSPNFEFEVPPLSAFKLLVSKGSSFIKRELEPLMMGLRARLCLVKHHEGLWIVLAFNAPKVIEECGINLSIIGGVLYFSNM